MPSSSLSTNMTHSHNLTQQTGQTWFAKEL